MGDRAITVFKSGAEYSPGVYVHWMGKAIPGLLKEAAERGIIRQNDPSYSAARFAWLCCNQRPRETTGVGLLDAPEVPEDWEAYSQGDAGVVVVDCNTGKVEAFAGYLADDPDAPLQIIKLSI